MVLEDGGVQVTPNGDAIEIIHGIIPYFMLVCILNCGTSIADEASCSISNRRYRLSPCFIHNGILCVSMIYDDL